MSETQQTEAIKNTADRVMDCLREYLAGDEASKVFPEAYLSDIAIDSLDKVAIIQEVENTFAIRISDDHVENILTVQQLIKEVEDRTEFSKQA